MKFVTTTALLFTQALFEATSATESLAQALRGQILDHDSPEMNELNGTAEDSTTFLETSEQAQDIYFGEEYLFKTQASDLCMDHHTINNNIYLHPCHEGPHQTFYLTRDGRIKSKLNNGLCMDLSFGKNIVMHPCHDGLNQKFYIDGATIKTKFDTSLCMTANLFNNNIRMIPCNGQSYQMWTQLRPSSQVFLLKSRYDSKCLDYNFNTRNTFVHSCHSGSNQRFHFYKDGRMTTQKDGLCMEFNPSNRNVDFTSCHGGLHQKWFFEGDFLKSKFDPSLCLDYNYNNGNAYMHQCHGGKNQRWYEIDL